MSLTARAWLVFGVALGAALGAAWGASAALVGDALHDALRTRGDATPWALALLAVAVGSGVALAWTLRTWRRAVDAVATQAEAFGQRRVLITAPRHAPELQRLARAVNAMARRLRRSLDDQAAQIDTLRAQAHGDPLTGLSTRRVFVAELDAALHGASGRGAGLLIVRVCALQAMNQRVGRDAADRLIAAVAQVLQTYPARVRGARVGRLNGSDFALYLPAAGIAAETAASLAQALRAALAVIDPQADLRIGGAELAPVGEASIALAAADEALARAESAERFGVAVDDGAAGAFGERTWAARLAAALDGGSARLGEAPVRDADGRLLHLECTLHLALDAGGAFEPPSRWAAMAQRCGFGVQADLMAIDMALAAIVGDGRPRAVSVAPGSLGTVGFVAEVAQRLARARAAAARLSIEFAEAMVERQPARLREACAQWRSNGARLGLVHAGASPQLLSQAADLGIDHVKIAGAFLHGASTGAAAAAVARGLASLLRGMRLQVIAQDVEDPADLVALWALGFDAACGPAIGPEP